MNPPSDATPPEDASPTAEPESKPDAPSDGPAMPGDDDAAPKVKIAKPPSMGMQVTQLVVIPAVIVGIAVAVAIGFAGLSGRDDSVDELLLKLGQSGGAGGDLAMGLQDPRYKDRSLAAHNLVPRIRLIEDPAERERVSGELIKILDQSVAPEEDRIEAFIIAAIGELGSEEAIDPIHARLSDTDTIVREYAVRAARSFVAVHRGAYRQLKADGDPAADRHEELLNNARVHLLPRLRNLLADDNVAIRALAALAVGELAGPGDAESISKLQVSFRDTRDSMSIARWHAAIALAWLGDEPGSTFVADNLLNREWLAGLKSDLIGGDFETPLATAAHDDIILSTLNAAAEMSDPRIWDRIDELATGDPNPKINAAARKLLDERADAPTMEATGDQSISGM